MKQKHDIHYGENFVYELTRQIKELKKELEKTQEELVKNDRNWNKQIIKLEKELELTKKEYGDIIDKIIEYIKNKSPDRNEAVEFIKENLKEKNDK